MKYKSLLICLCCLFCYFGQAQEIKNADFQKGNAAAWQFSNPATYDPSQQPGYLFSVIKDATKPNNFVAHFKSTGNSQWCQIRQRIAYNPTDTLEKIRISASIKVAGSENSMAGIATRILQGSKSFGFFERSVNSVQDWTRISFDFIVGNHTDSLAIFCTFRGNGEAWFDDLKIEKLNTASIEQSPQAKAYLDTAVNIIAKNALYKDSVDFPGLVQYAKIIASDAKTTADCYDAIQYLLEGLKDRHSFFQTPEEARFLNRAADTAMLLPSGKRVEHNIGYLKIPPCMAINREMELKYADSLQRLINLIDSKEIKGWIVDNRDNTGGNCWPMLLGLGPVLGDEVFNRIKPSATIADSIGYWNGMIRNKDSIIIKTTSPYKLYNPYPKVALLMNGMSASSGEIVILSFKNRPKARLFGEASYGLSTGNNDFTLSDGAMIFVCSMKQTDRHGNEYGGKIYPDVLIDDEESTAKDEVIEAAAKWLKSTE